MNNIEKCPVCGKPPVKMVFGAGWAQDGYKCCGHATDTLPQWNQYAALRARVVRLEEALPDPDKLEILARWFDMKYPSDANPEVQTDLREWAKKIRRALEEK